MDEAEALVLKLDYGCGDRCSYLGWIAVFLLVHFLHSSSADRDGVTVLAIIFTKMVRLCLGLSAVGATLDFGFWPADVQNLWKRGLVPAANRSIPTVF